MPTQPCSFCGISERRPGIKKDYFVLCSECRRSWHGRTCLYESISSEEMSSRNRSHISRFVDEGWSGWRCRECRGEGPEGAQYRPGAGQLQNQGPSQSQNRNPSQSRRQSPAQSQRQGPIQNQNQDQKRNPEQIRVPKKKVPPVQVDLTLDSDQVDLTLDSDSGPEVMVIDNPRTRRQNVPQSVPIPNPPRPAPVHEIILISPDRTPPRKPPDENSPTNQDSNNPLQYLPTPELQYLPTPELRYPSELSMNSLRRRSQSSVLDLSSMNLGTAARKACPVFPFPDPTPYVRPLGPSDPPDRPRTRPLPPGLRPGRASILGEHLLNATTDSRIVQILGIRELKANGWTLDRREQETAAPQPVEPVNKGKGRAFGERTRDWTPLVQREELARITERQHVSHTPPTVQKRAVLHLVPPPVKSYNPAWTPIVHPPRQPRKRSAKPRDPTVKVEQHEWGFGLS